jgi:hypothetical protein
MNGMIDVGQAEGAFVFGIFLVESTKSCCLSCIQLIIKFEA